MPYYYDMRCYTQMRKIIPIENPCPIDGNTQPTNQTEYGGIRFELQHIHFSEGLLY